MSSRYRVALDFILLPMFSTHTLFYATQLYLDHCLRLFFFSVAESSLLEESRGEKKSLSSSNSKNNNPVPAKIECRIECHHVVSS